MFRVSPYASTTLRFDWLRTWWRVFSPTYGRSPGGLRIITIWRANTLVGLLPLYLQSVEGVFGVRRLAFISTGEREEEEVCADYLNVLCRQGEEGPCLDAIVQVINSERWDRLELKDIPDDSPLLALPGRVVGRLTTRSRGACPIADLDNGFEGLLTRLSANARHKARRSRREAEKVNARLEIATAPTASSQFSELVRLHEARWAVAGKTGCFAAARFTEFHSAIVQTWVPVGNAILATLTVNGQAVVALYGFVTGEKFDFYQSGVDPGYSGELRSPGIAAHVLLMELLSTRGVRAYDFLRGSAAYKTALATRLIPLVAIRGNRWSARNAAYEIGSLIRRVRRRIVAAAWRENVATAKRILYASARRIVRLQETQVLRAGPLSGALTSPEACSLVTIGAGQSPEAAETAMQAAGEAPGLVAPRLKNGDTFFGWQCDGKVVAFGWATPLERRIAGTTLRPGPGRIFLYNFHTLPRFRGQGLYPSLLATMQHQLHADGATEFIIDVNSRNVSSLHGIRKAGFTLAARVTCLVFFRRWRVNLTRELVDDSVRHLL